MSLMSEKSPPVGPHVIELDVSWDLMKVVGTMASGNGEK